MSTLYFENGGGQSISFMRLCENLYKALHKGLPAGPPALPPSTADWRLIGTLRWCLRTDGPAPPLEIIRRNAEASSGVLAVRVALERRARILQLAYPQLSRNAAWQLTALGQDTVRAIVDTPDMLEFFEKEVQPIDLCEALA